MERLTEKRVEDAIAKHGRVQAAGWYYLAKAGYLPKEIAIWCRSPKTGADIAHAVRFYADNRRLPVPANCARKKLSSPIRIRTDWKTALRTSMMRTGMALVLTHPMLEYLCAVADGVHWDRAKYFSTYGKAMPDNFIATSNALLKRGLIEQRRQKTTVEESNYMLTPAGNLVVELLKLAGEFKVADAAIEKGE